MSRLAVHTKKQKPLAVLAVLVIAILGVRLLTLSHAESPYATVAASSGVLTSPAKVVTDSSASTGRAVEFGSSPVTNLQYPAQILNLSEWKITLPYDSSGKMFEPGVTPGVAVEVTQPALATFSDAKYFHVNSAGNGVVFEAPVNGATTSGSGYPRSELRQMASDSATDEASWNMNSSSINSETVVEAVNHLPEVKPQVVVAQIHDSSHDIIEILADAVNAHSSNYYSTEPSDCTGSGGDINNPGCHFDICYRYDGAENQSQCLVYDYRIGDQYSLTLSAKNNIITLSATYNGKTITQTITDTISGDASGNYFKAGCYTQSNHSTEGNYVDYGEDTIFAISDVYNP